jgi:PAS domain S-box-containing protein
MTFWINKRLMSRTFNFSFDFFNKFQGMCFILSPKGEILNSNTSAQLNLHRTEEELGGKLFFNLFDSAYREKTEAAFHECMEEIKSINIPSKIQIDNRVLSFNLFFTPYQEKIGNKEVNYCFVLARDITEEQQKELDLMRFYYVAEHTVNPLQITDLNGRMIYVNPAFVNASGFSKDELLGQKPSIFASGKHSKKFWDRMWTTINTGKVWVSEVENKRKTGEPFYTQLLISPIIDNNGKVTGFFGIHRDLSEKRILEKQLIHTQKMESIGTLAAGIAHEVGNPLASISAIVQVILRTTDDDFIKEKLGLVKNQVTRISKIIRDLVDFSRPSNYELQVTDINQNIIEAVEITKVGAKARDIEFELNLSDKIPRLPLIADQLQQIFVNILLNSVDAISEKKPKNAERIKVKSDKDEDNIILEFSDSGPGIPEENFIKIFEPFFTTKKEGRGTGLGLWVSYGIIKSFQGDIKVQSTVGKGTTFIITIPIQS